MERTRREFVKMVGGAALGAGVVLSGRRMAGAQAKTYKNIPTGPLKVGVMTLLSGTGALLGAPGLKGVQICAEKINSEGGILGRKIELVVEEETTPKETVEKFRKLTEGRELKMLELKEEIGKLKKSLENNGRE